MKKKTNLLDSFLNKLKKIPKKKIKGIHEPQFDEIDQKIVSNCIKKNEVSGAGDYVKNFEREIASFTGSKYVIATSTGTSALHLALQANGVDKNHEVLVPAFNFIAAANAILYCGATPHFVEISTKNLGIDVDYLSNYLKKIAVKKNKYFINRETKKIIYAIVPVYVFGNSYNVTKLLSLCKKYKIKIIEDSAEALGTFYKKKHAGTFGKAGCLSFNGNKIITTGLGGAVITNNHKLYKNIRDKVNNGKQKKTFELVYEQKTLNFRMASINAALGISQIKKLKKFLLLKRKLSNRYYKLFKNIKGVRYITEDKYTKSNHWLNTVEVDFKNNKQRIELFKKANKLKIPIRPAWTPLNKLKYLKKFPKSSLHKSDKIYKKIICLPSSAILGQ
tara:strand:+ start:3082 stop:4251 length:1170 start_codon:yes stop_codon:yes gene_type:complete